MNVPRCTAVLIAGIALLAGAVAIACDDGDPEVTEFTPAAGETSEAETPENVIDVDTGVSELDFTLDAAIDQNYIELARLTAYQEVECEESPEGAGAPPACREGEDDGSTVEVFPVSQCELMWVRPEDVAEVYERVFVDDATELVAVFEPASQPLSLETDYAAVLRTPGAEGTEGVAVWVRGGRIVHVEHDCGNFEGLYADDRVASFVVTPS